jgi:putative ubiquitin-RnfH superfamily antitoxin RatB of RatAB toxin-antitoxin module
MSGGTVGEPTRGAIAVTVVYALPGRAIEIDLRLHEGATVAEAIELSGIADRFPEAAHAPAGIFGKRVARDAPLAAGDRVEIYRPLIADAKTARRRRATRR